MKEKSGHKILNSNKNNIKIVIHNETKKKKRKRSKKKDKQDLHHAQIGQPVQPQGQAIVTSDGTIVKIGRGQTVGSSVDNHRQLALNYLAPVPPVPQPAPLLQIANAPAVANPLNRQALPAHNRNASPVRLPMRVPSKKRKLPAHQMDKDGLMKVKTLKELKAIFLARDPNIDPDLLKQLSNKNKGQAIDMFLDGSSGGGGAESVSAAIGGGVYARRMQPGEKGGGGGVLRPNNDDDDEDDEAHRPLEIHKKLLSKTPKNNSDQFKPLNTESSQDRQREHPFIKPPAPAPHTPSPAPEVHHRPPAIVHDSPHRPPVDDDNDSVASSLSSVFYGANFQNQAPASGDVHHQLLDAFDNTPHDSLNALVASHRTPPRGREMGGGGTSSERGRSPSSGLKGVRDLVTARDKIAISPAAKAMFGGVGLDSTRTSSDNALHSRENDLHRSSMTARTSPQQHHQTVAQESAAFMRDTRENIRRESERSNDLLASVAPSQSRPIKSAGAGPLQTVIQRPGLRSGSAPQPPAQEPAQRRGRPLGSSNKSAIDKHVRAGNKFN